MRSLGARSALFETVEVKHRRGSDDSKVVVTVEVKEKNATDK